MSKSGILIVNKKVIKLIDELLDKKYKKEGFLYPINRVDILLEALQLLEEKYVLHES